MTVQRGHHKNFEPREFIYSVNLFFLVWVSKVKECLERTLSVRVMDRVAGTSAKTRGVRNEKWSTAEKRHSSPADLNPSGGQISQNVRTQCGSGGDETPSRLSVEECGPQNLTAVKIIAAQHAVWIVASLSSWQNAEGIFRLSHLEWRVAFVYPNSLKFPQWRACLFVVAVATCASGWWPWKP